MAIFKEIDSESIKTQRSFLNQLVDILQQSVSGSSSRRKYSVWATGSVGPGVTSSMFQTVNDADFTLQTSNAIFDMTVGLFYSGSTVLSAQTSIDSAGKPLFTSGSMQVREKIDNYKQFASLVYGNATSQFYAPLIQRLQLMQLIALCLFVSKDSLQEIQLNAKLLL